MDARYLKKLFLLVVAVIVLIAFTAALFHKKEPISAIFKDGSKVTVEKVTVGFQHEYHNGFKPYADFLRHWPRFLPRLPEAKYASHRFTTKKDVLVVWISLQNASNKYVTSDFETSIEDEHGCVFAHHGRQNSAVGKMHLDMTEQYAYPRRQKQFKMILKKYQNGDSVTLTIPNPKVVNPPDWKPESLPAVRQSGDLKVTLKDLKVTRGDGNEMFFGPQFEMEEHGKPTSVWTYSMSYSDVTGNSGYYSLCACEPALKLTAEFFKTADAPFNANELWSLPEIPAPGSGHFETLHGFRNFNGTTIRLLALSGPGIMIYSNDIPGTAEPLESARQNPPRMGISSSSAGSGMSMTRIVKSTSDSWVFSIVITNQKPGQDILIYALNDQGKKTIASGYHSAGDIRFLSLPMDETTKSIRLNIVVQSRLKMEFMVKPPVLPRT